MVVPEGSLIGSAKCVQVWEVEREGSYPDSEEIPL